MSDPRLTPLKVEYGGEIHRIRVDLTSFKFSQLQNVFEESFSLQNGSYAVKYTDNEGDSIKVTSEEEFVEACTVFLTYANEIQSIRFTAVSIPMLKFQEATEPLMKALAALLDTLDVVKGKVEKEDWIGQCKRGLSITGEALSQAADDVRESFILCKQKIKEYEMQEKINEAVNELGAATQKLVDSVHSSMKSFEKDNQMSHVMNSEIHVNNQESIPSSTDNQENSPVMVEIPNELNHSNVAQSETVSQPEPSIENTNEENHQQESTEQENGELENTENDWDVVSADEEKYASEILIIKEIFPEVENSLVTYLLERYNRNIHITLNALAEM